MIAVDWGTSSLRLYRLADAGQVRERRRSDQGVLACDGRFGEVLAREIAGWDDGDVLLCGMVAGRGGWHEMPYLPCPAGNHALALGMQRFQPPGFDGRALWLVPGVRGGVSVRVPDVGRLMKSPRAAKTPSRCAALRWGLFGWC